MDKSIEGNYEQLILADIMELPHESFHDANNPKRKGKNAMFQLRNHCILMLLHPRTLHQAHPYNWSPCIPSFHQTL